MGLIQIYIILALATAFTALLGFFYPVLKEAKQKGISNMLIDSPFIACATFAIVAFVMAPLQSSSIIFPVHGEYFRAGLQRAVEKPDE